MTAQAQFFDFVTWLISMLWLVFPLVGPFVLMKIVLKFLAWVHRASRGGSLDSMQSDAAELDRRRQVIGQALRGDRAGARQSYYRRTRQ